MGDWPVLAIAQGVFGGQLDLDLTGTLVDHGSPAVPQVASHRTLLAEAGRAVHLEGVVGGAVGSL
jgi:hypothetical protein